MSVFGITRLHVTERCGHVARNAFENDNARNHARITRAENAIAAKNQFETSLIGFFRANARRRKDCLLAVFLVDFMRCLPLDGAE